MDGDSRLMRPHGYWDAKCERKTKAGHSSIVKSYLSESCHNKLETVLAERVVVSPCRQICTRRFPHLSMWELHSGRSCNSSSTLDPYVRRTHAPAPHFKKEPALQVLTASACQTRLVRSAGTCLSPTNGHHHSIGLRLIDLEEVGTGPCSQQQQQRPL